jgi:hypothetical protein
MYMLTNMLARTPANPQIQIDPTRQCGSSKAGWAVMGILAEARRWEETPACVFWSDMDLASGLVARAS